MSEVLQQARNLGLGTRTTEVLAVDKSAASSLPITNTLVPISVAGGVVEVLTAHIPTPEEYKALTEATSAGVTITVTTQQILQGAALLATEALNSSALSLTQILVDALSEDPSTRMVTLTRSGKPVVSTALGARDLTGVGAIDDTGFEQVTRNLVSSDVISTPSSRWRVTFSQSQVIASRVPYEVASPATLGMPRLVEGFAVPVPGLVLVSGQSGSGRTAAAIALASRLDTPFSYVSPTLDAPLPPSTHFTSFEQLPASTAPLVVDSPADSDFLIRAVTAAAAGSKVFVTISAADMPVALALLASLTSPSALAATWVGSVHCLSLPGFSQAWEHVFSVVSATPAASTALLSNSPVKIARALDGLGTQFVLPTHLALAKAVTASRISLANAQAASVDPARLAMALGDWDTASPEGLSDQIL